jgi:site-specific recombinase XerD
MKDLPFKRVYGLYERGGSFFIQFGRKRSRAKKQVTLDARTRAGALAEAYELGRQYEAGLYDPWKDKRETITLREAVERYLNSNPELSPGTKRERNIVLNNFAKSLPARIEPRDIAAKHVKAFASAPHLKPATQKGYHGKIRGLFRWLVAEGYLSTSPVDELKEPRAERKLPEFMTQEELAKLIKEIETDLIVRGREIGEGNLLWLVPAIRLAVSTGLRRQELLQLRWRDVDRRGGRIYVRGYKGKDGKKRRTKSGHDRTVPIFPMARAVLDELLTRRTNEDADETVLIGSRGKPCYPKRVSDTFAHYREQAGLGPEITWHTLRHTFASRLVTAGVPIRNVQEWMGHADMKTTMIYAHLVDERAHEVGAAEFA